MLGSLSLIRTVNYCCIFDNKKSTFSYVFIISITDDSKKYFGYVHIYINSQNTNFVFCIGQYKFYLFLQV